ncbi:MAG: two-component sensor histidine kinase [Lachnospiraceae bacterium]|nr:two-component sensor histidine kinase [Lachnospiraceae bacterium]
MKGRHIGLNVQLASGMMAMILMMVLGMYLMNRLFLGGFYLRDKQKALRNAFFEIDAAAADTRLYSSNYKRTLEKLCANSNLSLVIIASNGTVVIASQNENDGMLSQLFDVIFSHGLSDENVLEAAENYTIQIQNDTRQNNEYLVLSGTLSDGNVIMLRSAVQSMEDAALVSNRLLLVVGVAVGIPGMLFAFLFTKRVTKPVYEMNGIAKQMAELNFEAKYRVREHSNELDELGEHLNDLSGRLEQTIGELKQANIDLLADLKIREENEKMRREFLSNVSHELKTPISLIMGYAEGLAEHISDDPKDQQFYLDTIMDEAGRMDKLVKQLLTLNELEFGASDITMERFDLAQMVHGLIITNDILINKNEIKVSFLQESPVFVWGDAFRVEQVVSNYLSNAIHYAKYEKKIEIRMEETDGRIRTHFFNSGDPIDEEQIPFIWDKFYKTDKARSRSYGGSGIGLSIVKAVMESFKQAYGVTNFDNGVDFWFDLDK